jgi:sec-independent protein translocase protein TatB
MVTPLTIEYASLGMADSLILMVMALVVFGPRRLPQIGRQIGKLMYEFRKASNDFKFQMEEELRSAEEADRRQKEEERLRAMALVAPSPAPAALPADPQAQVIDAQFPVGDAVSPYPGEALYPVQPSVEIPAQREETYPRIQPPTTGEQVSATPPNRLAAQVSTADEAASPIAPEVSLEANPPADPPAKPKRKRTRTKPATEPASDTESVNPHG